MDLSCINVETIELSLHLLKIKLNKAISKSNASDLFMRRDLSNNWEMIISKKDKSGFFCNALWEKVAEL